MNDLERYFSAHTGGLIHKWDHYFEVYDRHLSRFRGTDVHVVEIGVAHGGSLQMWKDYFGPRARIYGVDINPACKTLEEERVAIFIGDQEDRAFLQHLAREIPRIDVLIDDGGHAMRQQIATFEELFAHVEPTGVYLCEDLHTSYWPDWGGGYRRPGTFVEYAKGFVDRLNAWHSMDRERYDVDAFTRSAHSVHFYDSVVVVEKRPMTPPTTSVRGTPQVPFYQTPSQQPTGPAARLGRFVQRVGRGVRRRVRARLGRG